jgi:predicted XRE-type DNA-binding protein
MVNGRERLIRWASGSREALSRYRDSLLECDEATGGPEEALAKARLADLISETIEDLGLTQTKAGELLGIDQGTVSKLVRGRLDGFSQERLIRYLNALGNDVEILVRRAEEPGHPGKVTVGRG